MGVKRLFFIFFFLLFFLLVYISYTLKINNLKKIETKLNHHINYIDKQKLYNKNIINIKTDVMNVKINLLGGKIQEVKLLKYQEQFDNLNKLKLLDIRYNNNTHFENGLIINNKKNVTYEKNFLYSSNRIYFDLINGQKILSVPITTIVQDGIYCTKTFILKKGSYSIDIEYKIYNSNPYPLSFFTFNYLRQKVDNKKYIIPFKKFNINTGFENVAVSHDDIKYQKFSLNNIIKKKLYIMSYSGWIAMLQKYFSIIWIFDNIHRNTIYATHINNQNIMIGNHSTTLHVFSHTKKTVKTTLWIGPNIPNKMLLLAPYLDYIIDYGWFWFISKPLLKFLNILYILVNNWGYAIILITLIIRMLAYPLVKSQYISAILIKTLQPEIENIKKKFQNNKKKINEKILELYKKHNVSPLGGLLSTLMQMPIFLSLYYMLSNSIELRNSPFIFWIHDLSLKDPYYILPLFMGLTMFFMQKTSPSSFGIVSIQGRIMEFLPLLFSLCVLWLPSGLVIYYIISNLITIIQQLFIYNNLKKRNIL